VEASYWQQRWVDGKIGFHEGAPNRWLAEHASRLGDGARRRVLVPLCGKTVDLAYLASRGFEVVGVELALSAAEAFFAEAGLTPQRVEPDGFVRLSAASIEIVVGDFFALTPAIVGTFDAYYDRAAVVALPAALRERYAATLRTLLAPVARGLLVTYEHDVKDGEPPFSVPEAEVARLFPDFAREPLTSTTPAETHDRLLARGGTFARDRAYAMRAP
jgi:thiopurine S-methyltransferase